MLVRHGRQLASKWSNGTSMVEKHFFDALFRWSRVGCVTAGTRRSSTQTGFTQTTPEETHSQKVRKVLRYIPNSVVVLTTMASSTEGVIDWNKPSDTDVVDPSLYRGMTLSSFTSFSMSPEPRVTFNIAFPSRTLSALTQTRYFLIHILNSNRVAAMIAHSFAKGSANEADPESGGRKGWPPQAALDKLRESLKTFEIIDHEVKPGLEGKHRRKRKVRLPLIDCEYATKSILECQVLGESDRSGGGLIRIGDHVLVVAKVTRILENGDPAKISQNHTFTPGPGLGYCDGDYITSGPIPQQIPLKALKSLTGHLDGKSVEPDVREDDTTAGKAAFNQ